MSLAILFHYLMLNMFRMLVHPSSGTCDLFVELFYGLYCCGSMCVGVTVWFSALDVLAGVMGSREASRVHTACFPASQDSSQHIKC